MEGIVITGIVFYFVYKIIEFSTLQKNRKHFIDKMSQVSPETLQSNINLLNDTQGDLSKGNRFSSLRWGVLALGVGLGWFIGDIIHLYSHSSHDATIISTTAIFVGIALIVVYGIERKELKKTKSSD